MVPNLEVKIGDVTSLSIDIVLSRRNPITARECRVWAPLYPKPQTEGYFVVVAESGTDEVLAVKRVGWAAARGGGGEENRGGVEIGSRPATKAQVQLPDPRIVGAGEWKERKVDVYVVSDSYVGLQVQIQGIDVPMPPVVEDGKKK
jgi:antiviral helicase SLH1